MTKLARVPVTVALLAVAVLVTGVLASAGAEPNTWLRVNIPSENATGGWVLAPGSDVQHLTIAGDGTLYCYANPSGTSYTLFKSTDNGTTWSAPGSVTDTIVDIAVARDDPQLVYYATASSVYRSSDAAASFVALPAAPGGAGSGNIEITSIDVTITSQRNRLVAVATRDTDATQYGGVYMVDENAPFVWTNTGIGNYDVYAVAFSPSFTSDRQIVAVVTDETDTFVTVKAGDSGWGRGIGNARLNPDGSALPVAVTRSAAIAFPDDYGSLPLDQRVQFVAIDTGTGNGDVYRVHSAQVSARSLATDLNAGAAYGLGNMDITSVAVSGSAASASLLAGAAASSQVYFTADGGRNWTRATKEPTGQNRTVVAMSSGFSSRGGAFAATRGTESAFSITTDRGNTWNQISLVDTKIDGITDFALSPDYSRDGTLFLLTSRFGGRDSLWRSTSGGSRWDRVYCSTVAGGNLSRVALSPQYGSGGRVVFLAGGGVSPAVWQSADNGQTFARRATRKPVGGGTFAVDAWMVADNSVLLAGSHDGTNAVVYVSANAGSWYATEATAGTSPLTSIALSPGYPADRTLLVGNNAGGVYHSTDGGKSFQPLPANGATLPSSGDISVAFDPGFGSNRTVYAASSAADKGVYRFIIGKSADWERIDSTLPAGGRLGQVVLSAGGVLYAANIKPDGGMERSLDPRYPLEVGFETVTRGLVPGAVMGKLCVHGNTLWSVDTAGNRLMTYFDNLAEPLKVVSPERATAVGNYNNYTVINVTLDWKPVDGATSYRWQLNYGADFSTVPAGLDGTTRSSSVRLPPLDPATRYYWRVRADAPAPGPWSATGFFTTATGGEGQAPGIVSPAGGASSVEVRPVLQWSAVPQAQRYELLVSAEPSFANPVVARTLPATAWQSDTTLNPGTTYYWKVQAAGGPWSAVSAFTTRPAASPAPAPVVNVPAVAAPQVILVTPAPAPAPQTAVDTPEWVKLVVGGLMLVVVLQLVIILALVMTVRKS